LNARPALELERVERRYGERVVLRDISFTLPAGETLAVLGANGAGKTTLLRVLAGLLAPHAGLTRVLGHELPRQSALLRGQIGLLGHEPLLYQELSPRENLRFNARLHGAPDGRIAELLERTNLSARADEPVRQLSRGMVQRVAVCRAVLHDPPLLLLDEPLAHLDPAAAEAVAPLIGPNASRFEDSAPRTRVLVSHDPGQAHEQADVVLGLRDGRAALMESPSEAVGLYQ
jgi:heme exporter protein A